MNLWEIIARSVSQRRLSSFLTSLSVALGVMLVTAILLLQHNLEERFREPGRGYSLVVGAPGSSLQLVLNAIYHLEDSPGLMPFSQYESLRDDPSVALAVPYAVGDSFRGYRVVGTTDAIFSERFPHPSGEDQASKFAAGRAFHFHPDDLAEALRSLRPETGEPEPEGEASEPDPEPEVHQEHPEGVPPDHGEHEEGHGEHEEQHDEHEEQHGEHEEGHGEHEEQHGEHEGEHRNDPHDHHDHDHAHGHDHPESDEAVIGAEVARALGVRLGDRIEPTHGVDGATEAHDHEHLWTVVGILRETGTAIDRLVFIGLDSFYRIPDHSGAIIPGTDEVGLSSVVLFPRGGVHKAMLLSRLRREPTLQVANVEQEVDKLFGIIGNIDVLFLGIAILVVVLGVMSILVSIYNTMMGRRREIAIMRAIGAPRSYVMLSVVGEATLLTFLGAVVGLFAGHLALGLGTSTIEQVAGFSPDTSPLWGIELGLLAIVTGAGALAGLLPAIEAYRTDVSTNLNPTA